ncbi:hypothetical protein NDU88_004174 [Pleurodeles waltl]|uniref:Endonuclease/exonuclease/phosphatase domain-containing protein n=1 Tax=Pleurodeles waltl TaxID=8319 RepID=A0AAV7LHS7_PLEWA|nr:hypothetical protein NDU88_004174 [Pleurodeles waltl]
MLAARSRKGRPSGGISIWAWCRLNCKAEQADVPFLMAPANIQHVRPWAGRDKGGAMDILNVYIPPGWSPGVQLIWKERSTYISKIRKGSISDKRISGYERDGDVILVCGDFNTSCDAINSSEIVTEDRNMVIPEAAKSCPKSTKKAEAFTDLMLRNGLRFVNGLSKSDRAAKATFDNGRSLLVIDYVIVNGKVWPAVLDMAVVSRMENYHNPHALNMRPNILGIWSMIRQAPGLYERAIAPSNCRERIRWDGEKCLQGLPQLESIMVNYGQFIIDALPNDSPLILILAAFAQ